jgi:large subunit ribosomal protein L28
MASAITRLPPVRRSPSTLQYLEYKHKIKSDKPYFKPRFTFKSEDRQHTFSRKDIRNTDPLMPSYPYGRNHAFREANFGLYGGATLQSGNKISKGRNKGKTLRHWFPNVRIEKFRSEALDTEFKIPATARVVRTIRKCGGLDQYVMGTKPARIKELGMLGWKLRWLVMTSPKMLATFDQQRRELGLPESTSLKAAFEDVWNDEEQRTKLIAEQELAWADLRQAAVKFEEHVQQHWVENGEKEIYDIPRLETLQRNSPVSLGLPEYLERVHISGKDEAAIEVPEKQFEAIPDASISISEETEPEQKVPEPL